MTTDPDVNNSLDRLLSVCKNPSEFIHAVCWALYWAKTHEEVYASVNTNFGSWGYYNIHLQTAIAVKTYGGSLYYPGEGVFRDR